LESAGLRVERTDNAICAQLPENAATSGLPGFPDLPACFAPLALALACLPALRGGEALLPELPQGLSEAERDDFLQALDIAPEGTRLPAPKAPARQDAIPWTAPSPAWAMAYALAAFVRPHLKLVNPGIMTTLWPRFWALYNALPEPQAAPSAYSGKGEESEASEEQHDEAKRKRVRLSGVYAGVGGARGEAGD
jgi:hypothetical protein